MTILMYRLKEQFQLNKADSQFINGLSLSERLTNDRKKYLNAIWYEFQAAIGKVDLIAIERAEWKERRLTENQAKIIILGYLRDLQTAPLDDNFFFGCLTTRAGFRVLVSKAVVRLSSN